MAADAPAPEVEGKLGGASSGSIPEMAVSGAPAPAVSAGVVAAGLNRMKGYSMAVYEQVGLLSQAAWERARRLATCPSGAPQAT